MSDADIRSAGWEALVHDCGADVAVVDVSGHVQFLSPRLRWWPLSAERTGLEGRNLLEVLPRELAEERLDYVRRACRDRQVITLVGLLRGARVRTTIRPLPDGVREPTRALIVARPAGDEPGVEDGAGRVVVRPRVQDPGPLKELTPRELEVLAMVGQGMTTAQIARTLCRSSKTVEAHRLSLGVKLRARNRVDLARIAIRAGLLDYVPAQRPEGQDAVPARARTIGHGAR